MLQAIALLLVADAAVCFGVAVVRRWALRHQALDIPNQRSSHFRPTPRGGGLAIALVTVSGWIALDILFPREMSRTALWTYACGASLVALVSWCDDLHSLSAKTRLAAHGLAAVAAVFALGYWHALPLLPGQSVTLEYAGAALTLVWIIGLTNAYNFMDGSDGIAGAQAVVAGLGWVGMGLMSNSPQIVGLALLLTGANLGFLLHNWPPARIFMGDVGSAFLGYSFAILPLLGLRAGGPLADAGPVLGLLPVWPFVFDAALTFLRRLRKGENVLAAHRSHLYQRLIIAGYSHQFVLFLYSALATVGAAAGIFWLQSPVLAYWCSIVLFPSLAWTLHRFVVVQERLADQAREEQPSIVPFPSRKRRAA